jgi:hypothetical protein
MKKKKPVENQYTWAERLIRVAKKCRHKGGPCACRDRIYRIIIEIQGETFKRAAVKLKGMCPMPMPCKKKLFPLVSFVFQMADQLAKEGDTMIKTYFKEHPGP